MRYVAIDYGEKRVGLAGSDSGVIVQPLEIVSLNDPNNKTQTIVEALKKYSPQEIVIGLPINNNGTEGPSAAAARALGKELKNYFPHTKINIINEFLTSIEAAQRSGRKQGEPIDDHAAAVILEQFFNEQKNI